MHSDETIADEKIKLQNIKYKWTNLGKKSLKTINWDNPWLVELTGTYFPQYLFLNLNFFLTAVMCCNYSGEIKVYVFKMPYIDSFE